MMSKILATALITATLAAAFIPCRPTNDTDLVSQSEDFIQLNWQTAQGRQGLYRDNVSRQLVADNSTQVGTQYAARGALVHFSETNATQQASSAPFVAMVSCDSNATDASDIDDIFTLARDRGAVAALLYSTTSAACLINSDYINNFEKPLDVYSTTTRSSALLIDSQFVNVDASSWFYDSSLLNTSTPLIWQELNNTLYIDPSTIPTDSSGVPSMTLGSDTNPQTTDGITLLNPSPTDSFSATDTSVDSFTTTSAPTASFARRQSPATSTSRSSQPPTTSNGIYLVAVLANVNTVFAQNSTGNGGNGNGSGGSGNGGQSSGSGGGSPSTGLAMIILYATTGSVTVLFLIVILSGAVKAFRNPERYGPRAGGHGPGSTRQTRVRGITRAMLDTFAVVKFRSSTTQPPSETQREAPEVYHKDDQLEMEDMEAGRPSTIQDPTSRSEAVPLVSTATIDPQDVDNVKSCPICVEDFLEGDDLRILPCQGQHAYHRDCIDPWLLGVSSLCPLCRGDLAGDEPQEEEEIDFGADPASDNRQSGFIRRLRQRSNTRGSADEAATVPSQSRFRRYVERRRRGDSATSGPT